VTSLMPVLACSVPVAAGWAVHAAMLTRRLQVSRRDPLTGLPARAAWTRQASRVIRADGSAVILLDLDKFKEANDTYGHAAGDAVLTATADRLRARTYRVGGGVCGRLGGDEFAVATRKVPDVAEVLALSRELSQPVALSDEVTVGISASIGVAARAEFAGLSAALGAADAAMYEAKGSWGGWQYATAVPARDPVPPRRTRHHGLPAAEVADLEPR
jgi:diguanylate cyclase (GGDEF)-like protein